MTSFFYNLALFLLAIIAFPFLLWDIIRHGKYRKSFRQRFGFSLPSIKKNDNVIWIHAISVGETRAVIPLYEKICRAYPHAQIVISSTTETGHAEAKRSLPGAAAYFFLPLDFSFLIKKLIKKIHPRLLILVESDLWYHLIRLSKEQGAKVVLVNGKVSERSARRYVLLKPLSLHLFRYFDHICVQSELHQQRFLRIGAEPHKISVTGNLKFDLIPPVMTEIEKKQWRGDLGIKEKEPVLVIGSTHDPEEEWLLNALDLVWREIPTLKVLLVPRHPERFSSVADYLKKRGISSLCYSRKKEKKGDEKVILIDAMGLLRHCYQLGELALVGGSFVSHVGGHNIFEPVSCGVPVLFGPHMESQKDLALAILSANAGLQIKLEDLPQTIIQLLKNPQEREKYRKGCLQVIENSQGSAERTMEVIDYNSLKE